MGVPNFATVDKDGAPQVRNISAIHYEGTDIYFLTARGKSFARQLYRDGRVQIDRTARIVSSGSTVAGVVEALLSEEAREALDRADVILSKGQGNYESLTGQGRHIFYSFLCKCELFTDRFRVPRLTGIFTEER